MKKGQGKGTVSSNPVSKARHARGQRSPSTPPPSIGKGPHVSKAVRGSGD